MSPYTTGEEAAPHSDRVRRNGVRALHAWLPSMSNAYVPRSPKRT